MSCSERCLRQQNHSASSHRLEPSPSFRVAVLECHAHISIAYHILPALGCMFNPFNSLSLPFRPSPIQACPQRQSPPPPLQSAQASLIHSQRDHRPSLPTLSAHSSKHADDTGAVDHAPLPTTLSCVLLAPFPRAACVSRTSLGPVALSQVSSERCSSSQSQ